ncbi:Man1-Src1p-C-terminal domain-containing protein [Peziza echinospora]|nr:Man1-Src1p-C-terminal domain-containing protein [Peziza echinospora]
MDEDPPYLQPGFDPQTLKVAELRGLLLEHDVDYPSTAKKAQLVDLFNEHIATHSRTILGARGKVNANTRKIVDVDRFGDPLELDVPPPIAPRRTAPRRSTRGQSGTGSALDESDIGGSITVSPVKSRKTPGKNASPAKRNASPSKRSSTRVQKVMDDSSDHAEPEPPLTVRKPRRKSTTSRVSLAAPPPQTPAPIYKQESEPEDPEKSPFSNDNPFQSGSPAGTLRSAAKEKRRKSTPRSGFATGLASERSSSRRHTDFPLPARSPGLDYYDSGAYDNVLSSKHQQHDPYYDSRPLSPERVIKKEEIDDEEDDLLQPGEEFTPEGQEEIEEAERESGAVSRRSNRRKSTPAPASLLWVVLGTILSAYFIWWRKEKIEIGYCSVGKTPPRGMPQHQIDHLQDWTTLLLPECELCPANAICKPNFVAECKDDYVLASNPLTFFGLIPIPPTCEPDTEKLRRIAILSDEAIKVLRKRAADVECGDAPPSPANTKDDGSKDEGKAGGPIAEGKGVDESELRRILYDLKAPKLSDAQFNELWKNALEDVAGREEIEVKTDSKTNRLVLASSSLAALPLICSIKLSLTATLTHYRPQLVLLVLLALTALYAKSTIQAKRARAVLVKKYVLVALKMLARAAAEGGKHVGADGEDERDVPVVQLRDRLLQHEFSPRKREEVWREVQKVVECNSNVRATSREVRGEVLRCWTWIGGRGGFGGVEAAGDGAGEAGLLAAGGGGGRWRNVASAGGEEETYLGREFVKGGGNAGVSRKGFFGRVIA